MLHDILDLVIELNSSTDADIMLRMWKYESKDKDTDPKNMMSLHSWTNGKMDDLGLSYCLNINEPGTLETVWNILNNMLYKKQRKEINNEPIRTDL